MSTKKIIKKIIVKGFCLPFKLTEPNGAILAYHSISLRDPYRSIKPEIPYRSIKPEILEQQILFLKKNNFHFLNLKDLNYPKNLFNPRIILLTFDDGLKNNFTNALPILKKYGVPAVFFIPVNFVGKKFFRKEFNCMSWDQINYLSQDPLFEIGSHGLTHRKLYKLSRKEMEVEIKQSKEILERNLGVKIKSLAFPFGKYNKHTIDILKKTGYSFGFTSKPFLLRKGDSLFELPRFGINEFSSLVFSDIFKKGYELYWKVYAKVYNRNF